MTSPEESGRMSPLELRASLSLASLFALRMLGLFLILPVFAVHAPQLSGGDSRVLVGMALGIYGLTQALLQIPFGMASDRYGRKRVIAAGLLVFAAGSFVAAWATDIHVVILGRAIQGAGAISAAVTALAADLTREQHRAKAMAMIGGSIGLTFAVSLVAAPALYRGMGMGGIFALTGVLSLAAVWVTFAVVPAESGGAGDAGDAGGAVRRVRAGALREVLRNVEQLRLNFGIFSLHMVQMAIFVVVPGALVRYGGLAISAHWKVYLPVVLGSFVLMAPVLIHAERRGRLKFLLRASIALLLAVELGFAVCFTSFPMLVVLLLAFFVAFNILEASLPSLVSRVAPIESRGTALGVYNTTQSLGLFAGGALGGWLAQHFGDEAVFVFGIAIVALWLGATYGMRAPGDAVERDYPVRVGTDPVALRELLLRARGVRDASIAPEEGIARLTVYPESFDERAVREIIRGESKDGIGQ